MMEPPAPNVKAVDRAAKLTLLGEAQPAYAAVSSSTQGRYTYASALRDQNRFVGTASGNVNQQVGPEPTSTLEPTPTPDNGSGDGGVSLWMIILLVLIIPLVSVVASYAQRK